MAVSRTLVQRIIMRERLELLDLPATSRSTRRVDTRIHPGRMTWMISSAPTNSESPLAHERETFFMRSSVACSAKWFTDIYARAVPRVYTWPLVAFVGLAGANALGKLRRATRSALR
jgi:hypothetical protein